METTKNYPYVEGVEDGIDFDAAYTIPDHSGVAWRLLGWAQKWEWEMYLTTVNDEGEYDPEGREVEEQGDEGSWIPDTTQIIAVMIGDDRRFTFDRDEPVVIPEDEFCHGCGQIGCTAEVWD